MGDNMIRLRECALAVFPHTNFDLELSPSMNGWVFEMEIKSEIEIHLNEVRYFWLPVCKDQENRFILGGFSAIRSNRTEAGWKGLCRAELWEECICNELWQSDEALDWFRCTRMGPWKGERLGSVSAQG
jgi:hypothetical protein